MVESGDENESLAKAADALAEVFKEEFRNWEPGEGSTKVLEKCTRNGLTSREALSVAMQAGVLLEVRCEQNH